jgi:hypothetical protein
LIRNGISGRHLRANTAEEVANGHPQWVLKLKPLAFSQRQRIDH